MKRRVAEDQPRRMLARFLALLEDSRFGVLVTHEVGHQPADDGVDLPRRRLVRRVQVVVPGDRYEPAGELVGAERPPFARLGRILIGPRRRLHVALGRLVRRQHLH